MRKVHNIACFECGRIVDWAIVLGTGSGSFVACHGCLRVGCDVILNAERKAAADLVSTVSAVLEKAAANG